MSLVEKYLKRLHSEYGYANPVQTRPKPKPGITGEDPEKKIPPGVAGPSGSQVDLKNDKSVGYDFRNFAQADYEDEEETKPNKKRK
jgi:hypothetical protein